MQNPIVTREKIAASIKATNGAIFGVEFIKKDGSLRKMTCRTGVKSHLRGGQSTTSHKPHLVTVFDTRVGEYRSINLDTIKSMTMFGQRFDIRQ